MSWWKAVTLWEADVLQCKKKGKEAVLTNPWPTPSREPPFGDFDSPSHIWKTPNSCPSWMRCFSCPQLHYYSRHCLHASCWGGRIRPRRLEQAYSQSVVCLPWAWQKRLCLWNEGFWLSLCYLISACLFSLYDSSKIQDAPPFRWMQMPLTKFYNCSF